MEIWLKFLESSNYPILTAFILGIMTAISPCPLATNITAIGFISKDLESKRRVFLNGIWYTLGRAITYTAIAIIIYFGASTFNIARFLQANGEKFLGPLLIIIGILLLDLIKLNVSTSINLSKRLENSMNKGRWWNALMLGMVFALAFCPYSGALYFGMLIPLTISSPGMIILPVIFAIATGLPVILFAYLIAYSFASLGKFYNGIKIFEKWFRRIVAILFIAVGMYYIFLFFLKS